MDIRRKIEVAQQAIRSISTHDDADLAVRNAALDKLGATIEAEREAAQGRVQGTIDAQLAEQSAS